MKIYSSLSNGNIPCYLKYRIPIMRRQFFKIISQHPEYVECFCNDLNNTFHYACRKWTKQLN